MRDSFIFDTGTAISDIIDPRLFGGNVIFGADDLWGTFGDKVDALSLNLLRYPGGGVAEDMFDLTDPDAQVGAPGSPDSSLSAFLAYCAVKGITPAIVIPTKRYVEDVDTGAAHVRDFVTRLVAGDFGPVPPDTILEIGNEFYSDTDTLGELGATPYGQMAARFALEIEAAAGGAVEVAVQAGRTYAQNNRIVAEFDTAEEKAAVDLVITHQYPWTASAVDARFDRQDIITTAWETAGIADRVFMSEWNIGSSNIAADDARHDYGLKQNPALLELMDRMVLSGVDMAAIWGIQQRTKTAIGASETDPELYSSGALYRMLSETLPGARAMRLETAAGAGTVSAYGYESDTAYVVYLAAGDVDEAHPVTVTLALGGGDVALSGYSATRLGTLSDPLQPKPGALLTPETPRMVELDGNFAVEVSFGTDFEVVQLVFDKAASDVIPVNSNGGADADLLSGGSADDLVRGHGGSDYLVSLGGNDDIRGGKGQDLLDAGEGNDMLLGGSGADRIVCGSGDDIASGGGGRDVIEGGAGNDALSGDRGRDRIYGGDGDDRIDGGADNDRLWGGAGADVFVFQGQIGFDRIWDFEAGDVIDLSAFGSYDFDDIRGRMIEVRLDVHILLDEGTIAINRMSIADFSADDFLF